MTTKTKAASAKSRGPRLFKTRTHAVIPFSKFWPNERDPKGYRADATRALRNKVRELPGDAGVAVDALLIVAAELIAYQDLEDRPTLEQEAYQRLGEYIDDRIIGEGAQS
jgi:hypothetical protein